MPEWTGEEESALRSMVEQGKTVEEMSAALGRSPEAVTMKLRRLGLSVPRGFKVTESTTTTTPGQVGLVPAEDLIEPEEALKMVLGALQRLMHPNISNLEIRRIRLMIAGLKAYVNLWSVYEDDEEVKKQITELESMLADIKAQMLVPEASCAPKGDVQA